MFNRRRAATADDDMVEDVRERPGRTWSPAQLVALVFGGAAIVFGAFALAETGLDLDNVTSPLVSVWGFHTTPLLALAESVWGVLMVIAGLRPIAGRALMAVLGGIAVAGGALIVLAAGPPRLHAQLGAHDRNGWLFLAAGAITLLAALVLPVVSTPGQRTVTQRHVVST
jgi:hypothetical protein